MLLDNNQKYINCNDHILIEGLAHNCSIYLELDVKTISCAISSFMNVDWLIIESDSDDDTLSVLVLWFRFQIQAIFKETTTKKIFSEMTVNDSCRKQNSYIVIF